MTREQVSALRWRLLTQATDAETFVRLWSELPGQTQDALGDMRVTFYTTPKTVVRIGREVTVSPAAR